MVDDELGSGQQTEVDERKGCSLLPPRLLLACLLAAASVMTGKASLYTARLRDACLAVFKIEAFNALQLRFGPSKFTSFKTTLQNATPNCKMKTSLKVLNIISPP